jgi:hypothetical protein
MPEEVRTEEKEKDRRERIQERISRKLSLIEDPNSVIVSPLTREGQILLRMTYGFDRVLARLRRNFGTQFDLAETVERMKKVEEFMNEFRDFVNGSGGIFLGFYETPEMKKAMAQRRNSRVINPRNNEGKEIALLIKRLDPMLYQFRSTCTDFQKLEEVVNRVVRIILKFDTLVSELSSFVGADYEAPPELSSLKRKFMKEEEPVVGESKEEKKAKKNA